MGLTPCGRPSSALRSYRRQGRSLGPRLEVSGGVMQTRGARFRGRLGRVWVRGVGKRITHRALKDVTPGVIGWELRWAGVAFVWHRSCVLYRRRLCSRIPLPVPPLSGAPALSLCGRTLHPASDIRHPRRSLLSFFHLLGEAIHVFFCFRYR
jgi:hypothetical protein